MRKIKGWALAAAVCAAMAAAMAAGSARAETLVLGGTGAGLTVMRVLGDAFARERPGLAVEVPPSLGSNGGIRAVKSDALDVGIIGRELTAAERGDIVQVPFATTAFVFLTSNRSVKNLTRADIGAIISGATVKWADGSPIRIILRPAEDVDVSVFKSLFPDFATAFDALRLRRELPVAPSDQDNADLAEQMAGSFTVGSYTQIIDEKRNLTILSIDGVEPTPANVANKRYPYSKAFYLVTKSKPSPLARSFLEFVASPAGRAILAAAGWATTGPTD